MDRGLERLGPLDWSNLRVEDHGVPMHVAALLLLDGACSLDAVRDHVGARVHLAPRLRQHLVTPRFGLGAPLWADDPGFDVGVHVRARAVRAPGDEAALLATCAALNEPRLDRGRPLWELWLLTGLADGRSALLLRLHHVLADGTAALALMAALFDASPDAPAVTPQPWVPRPVPGAAALFADNVRRRIRAHPLRAARKARVMAHQLRRMVREGSAPRLSFNVPAGPHRRLVLVRADLARAKAVAHAHGGKVNDVVLAAVAGGALRLLDHRGELTPGVVAKVSVAASLRTPADGPATGNQVGVVVVPVPVGEPDAVRRLDTIARTTAVRRNEPPYQPAGRYAQRWMVGVMSRQRLVNLLVSNLPGPPVPLYFAGVEVREAFQVGVVQGNLTISVGVLSYAGALEIDVVGDADAVPDLDVFAAGLSEALDDLGVTARSSRTR